MVKQPFITTVEVVPPAGPDPGRLLAALTKVATRPIDGFSVATNPVAKARMSALVLCHLIRQATGKPAILHLTTRDHNRLSLQGELWGARALGIDTVMVASGDFVAFEDREHTSTVRDVDVCTLVAMAREAGLRTGVVFDPRPESDGLARAVAHLERKAAAGAQFVVTQPVYDPLDADTLAAATRAAGIPVILGILPLRSHRHAEFLHTRVAGISIPRPLREAMRTADDPVATGITNARDMLAAARRAFAGACVMPPFDHYDMLADIL